MGHGHILSNEHWHNFTEFELLTHIILQGESDLIYYCICVTYTASYASLNQNYHNAVPKPSDISFVKR